MKRGNKKLKWVLWMLGLVLLSVTLTVLILRQLAVKEVTVYPWEEGSGAQASEIRLENVYITDNASDTIAFLYENESYRIPGKLKEAYRGVADICITGKEITGIYIKKAEITGTLLSYSEDHVEVEGYGLLPMSDHLKVYRTGEAAVSEASIAELAIGSEALSYIVGEGEVCAILVRGETAGETIRVLIKNGSSTEYDSLYLTASSAWTISGALQEALVPVDMISFLHAISPDAGNELGDQTIAAGQVRTAEVACEDGCLYITDADGTVLGEGYEGTFLVRESDKGAVLINCISIEDYVRYVLPSEMEDYFPYEAQKAQAICARTFAYSQLSNTAYALYGANLDDSTSYQVYNRFGTTELTDRAVSDTAGEVIVYEGKPITCYYYSTSPGMTETLEVWDSDTPDYICATSTLLEQEDLADHLTRKADFIKFISESPDSYDGSSPYYRWKATLDVTGYSDAQYGAIKNIAVTKRSASGYALAVTISFASGDRVLTDEYEIRTFLGQFLVMTELSDGTCRDALSALASACFIVWEKDGDIYTLLGGGFGHGIGMSQYAAASMAEAGMTCEEIIHYFYKNVEIAEQ